MRPHRMSTIALVTAVAVVGGVLTGCIAPPTPGSGSGPVGADCTSPPNLVSGASLFGCNLAGVILAGLDLSGANFSGANLTGSDLSGANLTNANFEGANLTGADLTGANLTGAVLSGAILIGAVFLNALLKGALFDYGKVFGKTGLGGSGTPVGGSNTQGGSGVCNGAWCPGYNEANEASTEALLCHPDVYDMSNGSIYINRPEQDLIDDGLRSVVTDSTTSFVGATFDFSGDDFPLANMRALSIGKADYSGATLIKPVIACQQADNARFTGATIHGIGVKDDKAIIYHTSLRNSDLAGSMMWLVGMADVDMTGSNATNADWTALSVDSTNNFPFTSEVALKLDDVNFSDALLGVTPNPNTGTSGMQLSVTRAIENPSPEDTFYSTFTGANFTRAHIHDILSDRGDFSGAQTSDLIVDGSGSVRLATFDTGWLGVNWTGTYAFDGATCPDGSTGSPLNACF